MLNNHGNNAILYNTPSLHFMGGKIEVVAWDKHLGNHIGNISHEEIVSSITNDFQIRVNMVQLHFKWLPTDIIYSIFKTYCVPLYGSQLWDLDSTAINRFYVAWRKAVRYILHLPRTTHCALLHLICDDMPISHQLCFRCITFFRSLIYSNNNITRYCARMALYGSRSSVSNSLTHVSRVLKCDRYDVREIDHV